MDLMLNLIVDGICGGARFAILAMGFALIFNTQRMFDISFGGVYIWSGFALWILVTQGKINLPLAAIIVLGFGFFLSYAIQKVYLSKVRSRAKSPVGIFLGSMAILMAMEATALIVWGGEIRIGRIGEPTIVNIGFARLTDLRMLSIIFAVSIFLLTQYVYMRSPMGVKARAIASNPFLGKVFGLQSEKIVIFTTCIGSTIVSLGSVLVCADTGVYPAIGFEGVMVAFISVILGGIGSFTGAAIGGFTIGLVRTVAVWKFPTLWQELILFLILFLMIAFRPIGILGIKDWKSEV